MTFLFLFFSLICHLFSLFLHPIFSYPFSVSVTFLANSYFFGRLVSLLPIRRCSVLQASVTTFVSGNDQFPVPGLLAVPSSLSRQWVPLFLHFTVCCVAAHSTRTIWHPVALHIEVMRCVVVFNPCTVSLSSRCIIEVFTDSLSLDILWTLLEGTGCTSIKQAGL